MKGTGANFAASLAVAAPLEDAGRLVGQAASERAAVEPGYYEEFMAGMTKSMPALRTYLEKVGYPSDAAAMMVARYTGAIVDEMTHLLLARSAMQMATQMLVS